MFESAIIEKGKSVLWRKRKRKKFALLTKLYTVYGVKFVLLGRTKFAHVVREIDCKRIKICRDRPPCLSASKDKII